MQSIVENRGMPGTGGVRYGRASENDGRYANMVSFFLSACGKVIQIHDCISILSIRYMLSILFYIVSCIHRPVGVSR